MRKSLPLISAFLVLASIAAAPARAEVGDERVKYLKSIISPSIETYDFQRITEALSSLTRDDVQLFGPEDAEYLKHEVLRAIGRAERSVDPVVAGALIDAAYAIFPDDHRIMVKALKSRIELGQVKDASRLYVDILTKRASGYDDVELVACGYAVKGLEAMADKRYDEAKAAFETAIERDPEWTGGYFLGAALCLKTKDYGASMSLSRKCLELNPKHAGAKKMLDDILPKRINDATKT